MTDSGATLVVVDMQQIFRSADSQWAVADYDEAAAHIEQLLAAHAGPVVWTKFVRDEQEDGAWRAYYDRWSECRLAPDSPQWDLTRPARPGDATLTLPTFSKWGPELARLAGDGPLIVCGVATDCCVLSTVLGAVDAGRAVTLVADACAGATVEAHDQAIALMAMLSPMVDIVTADDLTGGYAMSV